MHGMCMQCSYENINNDKVVIAAQDFNQHNYGCTFIYHSVNEKRPLIIICDRIMENQPLSIVTFDT